MLNPVKHFFGGHTVTNDTTKTLAGCNVGEVTIFSLDNFTPLVASPGTSYVRVGQKIATGRQANGKWKFALISSNASTAYRSSGKGHRTYTYRTYTAPAKDKYTFVLGDVVTPGYTVALEITFKQVRDLSPQILNQSFYYTIPQTTPATSNANIWDALRAQVMNDSMCRDKLTMEASGTATTIEAKLPPYDKQQRYEWAPVEFEASLSIITKRAAAPFIPLVNDRQKWGTVTHTTRGNIGVGYGPVMSDLEKRCQAYQGVTNITHFPVITPPLFIEPDHTYNVFTIEQMYGYRAADDIWRTTNEEIIIAQDTNPAPPAEFATWIAGVVSAINFGPTSTRDSKKLSEEIKEVFDSEGSVTVETTPDNKKKPVSVRV